MCDKLIPTKVLLEYLKKEAAKLLPKVYLYRGVLSNEKLSEVLGQASTHIKNMFSNARNDPSYIISLDYLEEYKENLKKQFGSKSGTIRNFINNYIKINNPRLSNLEKVHLFHPNLIEDYFKNIDTKEKAYWLGFIFADGSIYKAYEKDDYTRFGFDLARKDRILIERFSKAIRFNKKYINLYDRKHERNGGIKVYEMVKMEFKSNVFTDYLKKHGVVPDKTFRISLPDFGTRELNLAFLLGYFDGDGRQGTTNLRSGNRAFLEDIKEKYNLPFEVRPDKENPKAFTLSLGALLFNEMMLNYKESLLRKRNIFSVNKFKTQELTEEKLNDLVWEMPLHVIARVYSVSETTIYRLIEKYDIKSPPRNYWNSRNYLGKENEKSFDTFLEFYKNNPDELVSFYYRYFPFNRQSQIRKWVYAAKNSKD